VWFVPDGQAPIEAAVFDPELIDDVVRVDAAGKRVEASFDLVTIIGAGANARRRRVFTLQEITAAPEEQAFLLNPFE
jgi:hypothetical protein